MQTPLIYEHVKHESLNCRTDPRHWQKFVVVDLYNTWSGRIQSDRSIIIIQGAICVVFANFSINTSRTTRDAIGLCRVSQMCWWIDK